MKVHWVEPAMAVLIGLLLLPATASAQSAIAGAVTDTTGAVLPGVTVEARSPALIEQVRAGTTDGQGQYRIVDLRPGVYSVTFTMPGFNTVVREGIDLPANFTAPVNVQLRVGAIEETVTVTGASPVVDVQRTERREVLDRQLVEALPTGRQYIPILATLPSVTVDMYDVGGSTQMENGNAMAYGGESNDFNVEIDGMNINSMFRDGASISLYMDIAPIQEYVVQVSAGNAEVQTGGVNVNYIPREGGNQFFGQVLGLWSGPAMWGDNITPELQEKGAPTAPELVVNRDVNAMAGGPILQDRLWYFASMRSWAFNTEVFNLFHTGALEGFPKGTPVVDDNDLWASHLRLTAQLNPKNKISVMNEHDWKRRAYQNVGISLAYPEALNRQKSPLSTIAQAKWTSTMTTKLLVEAGWSFNHFNQNSNWPRGLPRQTPEDPFRVVAKVDLKDNFRFGAPLSESNQPSYKHQFTGSLSYVTGTHALKGGVQYYLGNRRFNGISLASVLQRYRDGVPNSAVLYNFPQRWRLEVTANVGLYIQDSWTLGRLTLNPGVRYDYLHAQVPAQTQGAGRWIPARQWPAVPNVPLWHDVTPRFGAAYDLFGTGRDVIKGSVGTYVEKVFDSLAARYNPIASSTDTRNWDDLNGNDIAEPNELGPSTNRGFGLSRDRFMDPDLQRARNTLYNLAFEHELRPGLGVSVAFNRRTYADLEWLDNVETTFDDYTLLTVPDPRGNGQTLPVYNLSRAKLGLLRQFDKTSNSNTRFYNGFDVTFHGRLTNGARFAGGTSTGHTLWKRCEVDDPNALRFCDESQYDVPFRTQFKLQGTYPLPRGFQVAAVFQSLPGEAIAITYPVTRTLLPALTVPSVSVRLNEPGSEYYERLNQLDVNLTGTIPAGRLRFKPQLDIFNALNASTLLRQTTVFGSSLGIPREILGARLVRIGLVVDF